MNISKSIKRGNVGNCYYLNMYICHGGSVIITDIWEKKKKELMVMGINLQALDILYILLIYKWLIILI